MSHPTVALVKGTDRYQNIAQALDLLGKEAVSGTRHVLKPNFVSTEVQLAATHREAARAVVDWEIRHFQYSLDCRQPLVHKTCRASWRANSTCFFASRVMKAGGPREVLNHPKYPFISSICISTRFLTSAIIAASSFRRRAESAPSTSMSVSPARL